MSYENKNNKLNFEKPCMDFYSAKRILIKCN